MTLNIILSILNTVLILTCLPLSNSTVQVKTNSGVLFYGKTLVAKNGQIYKAFLGIPYAEPPIGDLRFQLPVPAILEEEEYYATEFKPICIQIKMIKSDHGFGDGEEDCLYLNIFTPESAEVHIDAKKVLIFIHGGGNMNGFSNLYYPGALVTEKDIIVVTINYRLGFLGFLSSLTPDCEGNFGLRDQLLAISWVKENIESFGGDSNEITISGESAGGFDVSFLSLVPQSKNLFKRAFSMSGVTGVAYPFLSRNPRVAFIQLSRQLECLRESAPDPSSDEEFSQLVSCLKSLPASRFIMEHSWNLPEIGLVQFGDLFPASVEELFADKRYLESINFYDRDYLLSLCYNEGDIMNVINEQTLSMLSMQQRKAIPPNAMFFGLVSKILTSMYGPVSQQLVTKVIEYYSKNYEVNPVADFSADAIFHVQTLQYATAISKGSSDVSSKVRLFRFVHWPKYMTGPYKGIVHGADLLYMFDLDPDFVNKIVNMQVNGSLWDETDEILKKKYINIVGDFVKTGNAAYSLEEELPAGWPAFDEQEGHYLQLSLTPQVKTKLKLESVELFTYQIPAWIREHPLEEPAHVEL